MVRMSRGDPRPGRVARRCTAVAWCFRQSLDLAQEINPIEDRDGMSTPVMIEAQGLCKQYGSFLAVRDVTFAIPRGQVVAFLGPNGAGKTTTMRLLTGFVAPTRGTARIAGIDVQADRIEAADHLGYLPENGPLYPDMTPLSLLRFFGQVHGLSGNALKHRI